MPLVTIWRDPRHVTDEKIIAFRDIMPTAVREYLKTKPEEVEVRVRDIGPLDINFAHIGIEIDTGSGKGRWRAEKKTKIAKKIAEFVHLTLPQPKERFGHNSSYVWIRIVESAFVPIGHPEHAR